MSGLSNEVQVMATEESPLLGHTPAAQAETGDIVQNQQEDDVHLAEEPNTIQLLLVLGGVWIGCFLAAAGRRPHLPGYHSLRAYNTIR